MDSSTSHQVNALRRKFEELNEEISQSLRFQQETLSQTTTTNTTFTSTKQDILRLTKKAIDWKDDTTMLAKQIESQLQYSKLLRTEEVPLLLTSSSNHSTTTTTTINTMSIKQIEEDHHTKLRALRSDLRALMDFYIKITSTNTNTSTGPGIINTSTTPSTSSIETEMKKMKELIDKSIKKEKKSTIVTSTRTNGSNTSTTMNNTTEEFTMVLLELFEARRDIMSKITEEILSNTTINSYSSSSSSNIDSGIKIDTTGQKQQQQQQQQDKTLSFLHILSNENTLVTRDTQLYLKLLSTLLETRRQQSTSTTSSIQDSNSISSPRVHLASLVPFEGSGSGELSLQQQQVKQFLLMKSMSSMVNNNPNPNSPSLVAAAVGSGGSGGSGAGAGAGAAAGGGGGHQTFSSEEFNFTLQKLKREISELKIVNHRLILSNSQFEDELKTLSNKYEEEKKNRILEKKWYLPKIQKLEENVDAIQNSFHSFRVNVDLLSNLYQHINGEIKNFQQQEKQLIEERNQLNVILKKEIGKIVRLQKENQKKEQFVMIAMASREEILKEKKQLMEQKQFIEKNSQQLNNQLIDTQTMLHTLTQEKENLTLQVDVLSQTNLEWKEKNEQLLFQLDLQLKQFETREKELQLFFQKEKQQASMKYEELQNELIETTSHNVTLDARLRILQEKMSKLLQNNPNPSPNPI